MTVKKIIICKNGNYFFDHNNEYEIVLSPDSSINMSQALQNTVIYAQSWVQLVELNDIFEI